MIKTGQTGAIQQPVKYSYNPQRGYSITREWEGTENAGLSSLEAQLKSGGWNFSVEKEIDTGSDCVWRVSATRGGDSSPDSEGSDVGSGNDVSSTLSDQWELASNLIEKDILESDSPLMAALWGECAELADGLTPGYETHQDVFDTFVNALKKLQTDPENVGDWVESTASSKKLARLINAGCKYIRIYQPTLRHNKIVSSKYEVKDALTNCGKIIKASSIDALEGIPTTILFNLPSDYDSVRNIGGDGDELGTQLKYGWFKKYPNVNEQAGGEWQISQEFEWGLWHVDLYEFV